MRCPNCNYRKMHVVKSLDLSQSVKRKRECYKCGEKIDTVELCSDNEDDSKIDKRLKKLESEIKQIKKNNDL
tara:strand:+ start:390 stop:605 length:216 start_codon:yes stop_codon:yes gene_type:complete